MTTIGSELAAFLQEGIGMQLGTRNARLEPNGVRVVAVTVEGDGTHLTAYVPRAGTPQVLADLEANGEAAIVFARPPDERAAQVKGVFVSSRPAKPSERAVVQDQWTRWLRRLEAIGYPRATWEHYPSWPCVAIRVRVTALFEQTPGPKAGTALT